MNPQKVAADRLARVVRRQATLLANRGEHINAAALGLAIKYINYSGGIVRQLTDKQSAALDEQVAATRKEFIHEYIAEDCRADEERPDYHGVE